MAGLVSRRCQMNKWPSSCPSRTLPVTSTDLIVVMLSYEVFRYALKTMKIYLIVAFLICGQAIGLRTKDDVALSTLPKPLEHRVVIFGDTHITGPEYPLNTESTELDNDSVVRSQMRLYAAVKKINALDPSLVLILGDVVHDGLRLLQGHVNERGLKKLFDLSVNGYTIASDIYESIEAKKLYVWGNHDHMLDCKQPKESISHGLLRKVYRNYFEAEPYDTSHLGKWMFISLNSMWGKTWNASDPSCNTELSSFGQDQLDWLDDQLKKNSDQRYVIILMHFPPGTIVDGEVPGHHNADLKSVLERHRHQIKGIMSGHFHKGIEWGSIFGQIRSVTLPSTRYNSENYFNVNLYDNGTWAFEDFSKNRGGARCSDLDATGSTTRDVGNCGIPLVSYEETFLLEPVLSMSEYPDASTFNPEGSCRFQFAPKFFVSCLRQDYLETDCCEILSQAFWPSSSHPFSACLCQKEFWDKAVEFFDLHGSQKFASVCEACAKTVFLLHPRQNTLCSLEYI
jgi:3',5'-cyclic AMP phosphodiesterase CpdA